MKTFFAFTITMMMTQVSAYYLPYYNNYGYNVHNDNNLYGGYDKALVSYGYYSNSYGYTIQDISNVYYAYNPNKYHDVTPPIYGGSRKMLSAPSTYSDYFDDYTNGGYDDVNTNGDDNNYYNNGDNNDDNNDDNNVNNDNDNGNTIPQPSPPPSHNSNARVNMKWFYCMYFISVVVLAIVV